MAPRESTEPGPEYEPGIDLERGIDPDVDADPARNITDPARDEPDQDGGDPGSGERQ